MAQEARKNTIQGIVVKLSDQTTATVRFANKKPHPLYKKIMTSHKNFTANIPEGVEVEVGNEVTIAPIAPMSKTKRWEIIEVTKTA